MTTNVQELRRANDERITIEAQAERAQVLATRNAVHMIALVEAARADESAASGLKVAAAMQRRRSKRLRIAAQVLTELGEELARKHTDAAITRRRLREKAGTF